MGHIVIADAEDAHFAGEQGLKSVACRFSAHGCALILAALLLWDISIRRRATADWSTRPPSPRSVGSTAFAAWKPFRQQSSSRNGSSGPAAQEELDSSYECGSELRPEPISKSSGGRSREWMFRSWAEPFIRQDLERWRKGGISQESIAGMAKNPAFETLGKRFSNAFRFQIVGGRLYLDYAGLMRLGSRHEASEPPAWFPAASGGPGSMATSGRVPLALLALYELLWLYPGQVPDVDAVIHFDDVAMANLTVIPDSPPLFSYGSNAAFAEVPFPDWTYWGSTGPSQQRTWQGETETPLLQMSQGWSRQRDYLLHAGFLTPLRSRAPILFYRGRASSRVKGDRKRVEVVKCTKNLPEGDRHMFDTEGVSFTEVERTVHMDRMCGYRYLVYVESYGFSASLKSRLACGSVLFQVKPQWDQWFSRGLQPGTHYLEVPAEPLAAICPALLEEMLAIEDSSFPAIQGQRPAEAPAPTPSQATATAIAALEALTNASGVPAVGGRRLLAAAPLSSGKNSSDRSNTTVTPIMVSGVSLKQPLAVSPNSTLSKAASMALAQTEFVQKQLRMQDVREYILDVLGAYAQLQRFSPAPSEAAQHVTADLLLRHFLFDEDRAAILAAYPWLRCQLARGL